MSLPSEISQRDLRARSREIMDAVERGQSFTVTRDGHEIGELIPLRKKRRFLPVEEFIDLWKDAPQIDGASYRADIDAAGVQLAEDPYER